MNILVYDKNSDSINIIKNFFNVIPHSVVDSVLGFNHFCQLYEKKVYDIIFLDSFDKEGKKISDLILKINPLQRTIILNNKFENLNNVDCNECKNSYNRDSIINPISYNQLLDIVNNKHECEGYKKTKSEFNMQKIKNYILKNFPTLKFDLENEIINISQQSVSLHTSFLVELTQYLNESDIRYSILDNFDIKIHRH